VDNNTFTPVTGSTTFRHITVNTKELNTSSATVTQTDIDGTFTKNKFYGSGTPGGKGMVFLNHDSNDDAYGTFTVGGAGVLANEFNTGIATFMEMDGSTGDSWPSAFPENDLGAAAVTTMACWAVDINIESNKFDVSGSLKLPINMTSGERTTLETKLMHKPDNACLGKFIFFKPLVVTAQVILQGPYDTGSNFMNTALGTNEYLPFTTPYVAGLHTTFTKVNNFVTETTDQVIIDNNEIVDWVWLELRSTALGAPVATRSALLQKDGDIVDVDGVSAVSFPDTYEGDYFLMVRHRNHLAAMSKALVPHSGGTLSFDFRSPAAQTYGSTDFSARRLVEAGVYGLWAGNTNLKADGWRVKYNNANNDRLPILTLVGINDPLNVVNGYYLEDVNCNGQVKYSGSGNDRIIILNNVGIADPLNTILQQPND
jgi:hypothetical protein